MAMEPMFILKTYGGQVVPANYFLSLKKKEYEKI